MPVDDGQQSDRGISSLPPFWSAAVQLIGTFGLAVFLVLYYVLVMHPQERQQYGELRGTVESLIEKEREQYGELREAVESLIRMVEREQKLLTDTEVSELEGLYVYAVAGELCFLIHDELEQGTEVDALAERIGTILQRTTEKLEHFTRKDGRSVSEPIVQRLAGSPSIGRKIAESATTDWRTSPYPEIYQRVVRMLGDTFVLYRIQK